MKIVLCTLFLILSLSLYKVVDAVTCKYYPNYPYSYASFTAICSSCCYGYPTNSIAACGCSSSSSSNPFQWYYVVAPLLSVIIFCIIIPILFCICISNSNRRNRIRGQGSILSRTQPHGNVIPYPGLKPFNNRSGQIINVNNLPNNNPIFNNNYNPPSNGSNNPFLEQAKYNDFSLENPNNQPKTINTQDQIMPTIPNSLSTNPGSIF